MAAVLAAGRRAGLTLYAGPLGLPLASVPGLPPRAATSPRVTLAEAARQWALAGRTPAGGTGRAPRLSTPLARRWVPLVDRVAREERFDPALAHAIVAAESAYDPFAVSPKQAAGLMQLMPATAERFGLPRDRRAARSEPARRHPVLAVVARVLRPGSHARGGRLQRRRGRRPPIRPPSSPVSRNPNLRPPGRAADGAFPGAVHRRHRRPSRPPSVVPTPARRWPAPRCCCSVRRWRRRPPPRKTPASRPRSTP